jgi:hypothetical protein
MNKWWYVSADVSSLNPDVIDKISKTRETAAGVVHLILDPITKEEIPYSVDEVEERFKQHYGLVLPCAFDIIKSITPTVIRSFLVYDRKSAPVRKHVHPPVVDMHGKHARNRRTLTVGVPYRIVEPVNDGVYFYSAEIDYKNYRFPKTSEEGEAWHNSVINQATTPECEIMFPSENQLLILDFDSTKTVHWGVHRTENEYMFIVCDL